MPGVVRLASRSPASMIRRSGLRLGHYGHTVRLGVISDIHGVANALRAVLEEGAQLGVDRWWVLGDLVLFGPHPVEVLEMLTALEDVAFVAGNTDRYVLTDDQPPPHSTPEAAAGDADLVRRYGLMAAGAAWTRGVLDQAGVLGVLDELPDHQHTVLSNGTTLLGVHASPGSDDGAGFDTTSSDGEIRHLLGGVDADWVVGGHTHDPTDRAVAGTRVLNPGSVGLPRSVGSARWMLIEDGAKHGTVEHRAVDFDVEAEVDALNRRRHPNRKFIASVLSRGTFVETT
jgi:predicted phosphodiesterase